MKQRKTGKSSRLTICDQQVICILAGERLTDKYYHSIKKSAQIVLWTNWVSFIWLTIWRLIFPHKHSYLKENRFLDKLSPRVLGFSDFLSTGQKRRKIYFQKIFLEGDFFPCMIQMFQSLKVGRRNLLHNRLSQIQNASTSLERLLGFLPHPGKCFQLKSCRGSNWNPNPDPKTPAIPLWLPSALHSFIISLCSTVFLPSAPALLGVFFRSVPLLCCALWDHSRLRERVSLTNC